MPGRIKVMIEKIIMERSKGNIVLLNTIKTKLLLKGINPDKFGSESPDDPAVIAKLQMLAQELNVKL
jgi:hypothetical protein